MHRLVTVPGADPNENASLVEQEAAPILFLTSASTDISTLSATITQGEGKQFIDKIRALPIASLDKPAQVDYYLANTANNAQAIIVRLLGGKGHWGYGLEQLCKWKEENTSRHLMIISGTNDMELELHPLSSTNQKLTDHIAELLREGGRKNMLYFLKHINNLISGNDICLDSLTIDIESDVIKWDWRIERGVKVGIVLYKSLYKSDELELPINLNKKLRESNFAPKLLWVNSLSDKSVQESVLQLFKNESVEIILSGTSFSSTNINCIDSEVSIWNKLDVPILQMIISGQSKEAWKQSSLGLNHIDLSLQIVLPEVDGKIITRPVGFRNNVSKNSTLNTAIKRLEPDKRGIDWIVTHAKRWIELKNTLPEQKKIALIVANYPVKDGRLANGVGLDTPQSTINILTWLKEYGCYLGDEELPINGLDLMNRLTSGRTNSSESLIREPLCYLSIDKYQTFWNNLSIDVKNPIIERWGKPEDSIDLEPKGFAINGIYYGNIVLLIQPSRGYDPNSIEDIHSPDLPPPHRYLAQYFWLNHIHKTQLMVHIGKHGTAEWLPGKGVGLSESCYPGIVLNSIPHIYPFIVNDPGEGSQSKRRGNSVIIDHLTPPLGRAGLHGDLVVLETLLDEYYIAQQMQSERIKYLESRILDLIKDLHMNSQFQESSKSSKTNDLSNLFNKVDAYLCELKESQIRLGLHIFGQSPKHNQMSDLLLSISRVPTGKRLGITQVIAEVMNLDLDPWCDEETTELTSNDIKILSKYINKPLMKVGDAIDWIEAQAYIIIEGIHTNNNFDTSIVGSSINEWINSKSGIRYLDYLYHQTYKSLIQSGINEKDRFLDSLSAKYIPSGPSGAPTRGKTEVLPTGKNFYSIDLRSLPTEAAWDLGRKSAEQLIEMHLQEHGEHLRSLALSVWGTATMRNGGEDIAQLLALLGIRPIWDGKSRRVVDIEVIPISILQRPRVDVTLRISGLFRDAFPNLVTLVVRAQKLIANLNEGKEVNPYADIVRREGTQNRVYGSAPGSYGAGLQALIDSGNWESKEDLANSYIAWSKWSYDENIQATCDETGLRKSLKNIQIVMHNQDNKEHDILDSDDYYQFHGGLSAAVDSLSEESPEVLIGDHSRPERIRIKGIEQEIDKVVRSRVLNPRWINGMKQHSYKGAFEMSATLDYMFAYDATTNKVPDWCYTAIYKEWIKNDDTIQFLEENNPWALKDICERLIEASNRSLWSKATKEQIDDLKMILNSVEGITERLGI